jgi:hypothetical protein
MSLLQEVVMPSLESLRTPLCVCPHVKDVVIGDQTVLVNLDRGIYFGLDEMGTRVWDCIRQSASVESIVSRLEEEYDVCTTVLTRDIARFVEGLRGRGLITVAADPVPLQGSSGRTN